jgi:hypothetical protein
MVGKVLAIPLKKAEKLDWETPLTKFITDAYSPQEVRPETYVVRI